MARRNGKTLCLSCKAVLPRLIGAYCDNECESFVKGPRKFPRRKPTANPK